MVLSDFTMETGQRDTKLSSYGKPSAQGYHSHNRDLGRYPEYLIMEARRSNLKSKLVIDVCLAKT